MTNDMMRANAILALVHVKQHHLARKTRTIDSIKPGHVKTPGKKPFQDVQNRRADMLPLSFITRAYSPDERAPPPTPLHTPSIPSFTR